MAKIISITNNKGGVGKTTTAVNLAAIYADAGLRVAIIDNDPQGNVGIYLGQNIKAFAKNMADVYLGTPLSQVAVGMDHFKKHIEGNNLKFNSDNMTLFPADEKLNQIDEHVGIERLSKAIKEADDKFDLILIDNGPSVGFLTASSLLAADMILIPTEAGIGGVSGITKLLRETDRINTEHKRNVMCRVFVNDFQYKETIDTMNLKRLKAIAGERLYLKVYIPSNVHLKRAKEAGLPVNLFERIMSISSPGAAAYRALARLILQDLMPELLEDKE